jgi:hypothetical protein
MKLIDTIKAFFGGIDPGMKKQRHIHPGSTTGLPNDMRGGTSSDKDNLGIRHKTADSSMQLRLSDVEPFNVPPVDNDEAARFMRHMTGREPFTFNGSTRPRSFLINSLKFAHPRHSFAHGFLLSCDVDTLRDACSAGSAGGTMQPILKQYIVGTLHIECGGNLADTVVTAATFKLR